MTRVEIREKAINVHHFLDASTLVGYEYGYADGCKDERKRFAEWLDANGFMRKMDLNISRVEEALYEYEKMLDCDEDGDH